METAAAEFYAGADNHTGITLGTSSTTPNGNPRQNIIDSTNGLPAKSGCYNFSKCGPTTYLSTKMLQALLNLANQGNSFYVTAFAGDITEKVQTTMQDAR